MSLSIKKYLVKEVTKEVQEVGVNLLSALSVKTPVDEGTAVYSWITSIGKTDDSLRKSDSKEAARSQMVAVESPKLLTAIAGVDVYVQNNQPYIERLNNGWSEKAPSNFVESAIAVAVNGN